MCGLFSFQESSKAGAHKLVLRSETSTPDVPWNPLCHWPNLSLKLGSPPSDCQATAFGHTIRLEPIQPFNSRHSSTHGASPRSLNAHLSFCIMHCLWMQKDWLFDLCSVPCPKLKCEKKNVDDTFMCKFRRQYVRRSEAPVRCHSYFWALPQLSQLFQFDTFHLDTT